VLQILDASSPEHVFDALVAKANRRRQNPGTEVSVVASGLEDQALTRTGTSFDQGAATVWRRRRQAAWAVEASPYADIEHELLLCLRRGSLVALLGPDAVRAAVERWIAKPPRPPIRRVRAGIMNASLLSDGEAKTMWLTNVRGSTASRPDSKTLSGVDLVPALDPIGDGSFALGAARVAIPDDENRAVFKGTIGTTPRRSRVWSRATSDVTEFLIAVDEALQLFQSAIDSGADLTNPYEMLSTQVDGLSGVHGAFEFRCPLASDLASQDATPEEIDAARGLESATIDAEPVPNSPDVILTVGRNGTTAGRLRVSVSEDGPLARVVIGHEGEGTDPEGVTYIRDRVRKVGDCSIFYVSGHAVIGDTIYQQRREIAAFTNWQFRDMSGYQVNLEKPITGSPREVATPQEIHAAIGENGDNSLFAWVAHTYREGTLLCDDGSGEIADFLHLADDGALSLIHVKSAGSPSPRRRVAVAHYEVVVGQAVKNLVNLDMGRIFERLNQSPIATPAAWSQGIRVDGRQDFLDSLACREPYDPLEVVIVQPHVTQARHRELRAMPADATHPDVHRLRLLDTLLNSALVSCIGSNAKFTVVGAA
jgi:hypothetical protein